MFLVLAACQPVEPSALTPEPPRTATQRLQHTLDGIELTIVRPAQWDSYADAQGIVLAEHMGSVTDGGVIDGVQLQIFLPSISDLDVPTSGSTNRAWLMLSQVIQRPEYVGQGAVSEPVAFIWDMHNAAYYLMTSPDGYVTLLLAVNVPRSTRLMVFNASAPAAVRAELRARVLTLLDGVTLNGVALSRVALETVLPETLTFPTLP